MRPRLHLPLALVTALGCRPAAPGPVPAGAAPIADVARAAGRPPAEVDAVLGAPIRDPQGYRGLVWYGHGVSVRYRGGRADWIQATGLGRYRSGPEVLRLFGVAAPPAPTRSEGRVLRWDAPAVPPFAVVTLHTHARLRGGTDYVNFYVSGQPADSIF